VYGERQSAHGAYAAVIAKFTQLLRAKQPITIFGDGTQTRDFVPVQHVVNANLEIGTGFNLTGEIFNIASGKSISLLELVAQLEQELHTKAPNIIFAPARDGDIKHSQAYCEKYKNFLFNKEFY
jgi:UDP-glucose 4-epimerase